MGKLAQMLEGFEARRVVLLCHHNADPDAVCSAYALSYFLRRRMPSVDVLLVAVEGLSLPSKRILSQLPDAVFSEAFDLALGDVLMLVDTCSLEQLGSLKASLEDFDGMLIVVDHHEPHPSVACKRPIYIVDVEASSTAEVVFRLFQEAGVEVPRNVAFAIMAGIVYDSRRFLAASGHTFKAVARLVELGADYKKVLSLLKLSMDVSERTARLKAAQRMKLIKVEDSIIATSTVSCFEASAARSLIELGADVAIVAGGEKGEVRMSARASEEFYERFKVHLGKDVMEPLGRFINGAGGGHATAAGANGRGEPGEALGICIKILREKIGSKINEGFSENSP